MIAAKYGFCFYRRRNNSLLAISSEAFRGNYQKKTYVDAVPVILAVVWGSATEHVSGTCIYFENRGQPGNVC